jgi:hypothetical protein
MSRLWSGRRPGFVDYQPRVGLGPIARSSSGVVVQSRADCHQNALLLSRHLWVGEPRPADYLLKIATGQKTVGGFGPFQRLRYGRFSRESEKSGG